MLFEKKSVRHRSVEGPVLTAHGSGAVSVFVLHRNQFTYWWDWCETQQHTHLLHLCVVGPSPPPPPPPSLPLSLLLRPGPTPHSDVSSLEEDPWGFWVLASSPVGPQG
ncbi:hypothetical protein CHARACLAT_021591 [Characodon lateralis]|uniref:Uncharacterized protein n=1 Tax=Characodon lateralis TaxID=208331 RepID=A0ABU7DAV4_9TELE|nr:hypothetical protein [Characodon lateralis]